MRRLSGVLLAGAILMLPAFSQHAFAQGAAPQKFTLDGDLALWSVAIRPDKTGEYEKILAKVSRRLASHEWYVARYYWDRDKPMGTVLRLRRLLERYRGVGYDEEALWLLGRAYVAVDMPDRARTTWTELTQKFPRSSRAGDARSALASLGPKR